LVDDEHKNGFGEKVNALQASTKTKKESNDKAGFILMFETKFEYVPE